jgi:hypothetical protein
MPAVTESCPVLHAARVGWVVLVVVVDEARDDEVVDAVEALGVPPPQAASSKVKAPSVATMARRIGRITSDPQ